MYPSFYLSISAMCDAAICTNLSCCLSIDRSIYTVCVCVSVCAGEQRSLVFNSAQRMYSLQNVFWQYEVALCKTWKFSWSKSRQISWHLIPMYNSKPKHICDNQFVIARMPMHNAHCTVNAPAHARARTHTKQDLSCWSTPVSGIFLSILTLWCVCVCVCVCVCATRAVVEWVCIHMYLYMYMYMHMHIYVYMYMYMHMHMYMFVCVCVRACVYLYICVSGADVQE
jgi:hypothetical protein